MGGDQVIPKLVPGLMKDEGDGKAVSERRKELIISRYGPKPASMVRGNWYSICNRLDCG